MTQKAVSSITLRETIGGIVMAVVFSSIFFYLPFRGIEILNLGPGQKFPLDFLLQAFFLGFFCSLMPQLLTLRAVKKGALIGTVLPLKRILLRSFIFSIIILAIFGGGAFLITNNLDGKSLSFSAAWAIKIAFATLIAIIITPFALKPLREPGS